MTGTRHGGMPDITGALVVTGWILLGWTLLSIVVAYLWYRWVTYGRRP